MKYYLYFIIPILYILKKVYLKELKIAFIHFINVDSLFVIYDNEFSDDEIFTIEILQGQLANLNQKYIEILVQEVVLGLMI